MEKSVLLAIFLNFSTVAVKFRFGQIFFQKCFKQINVIVQMTAIKFRNLFYVVYDNGTLAEEVYPLTFYFDYWLSHLLH